MLKSKKKLAPKSIMEQLNALTILSEKKTALEEKIQRDKKNLEWQKKTRGCND